MYIYRSISLLHIKELHAVTLQLKGYYADGNAGLIYKIIGGVALLYIHGSRHYRPATSTSMATMRCVIWLIIEALLSDAAASNVRR